MHYEVRLMDIPRPVPVEADKFALDEPGFVVFYSQFSSGFEETARFNIHNVKGIEETK